MAFKVVGKRSQERGSPLITSAVFLTPPSPISPLLYTYLDSPAFLLYFYFLWEIILFLFKITGFWVEKEFGTKKALYQKTIK